MLTIFTPTYNRGYVLKRLFESLLKQSCFEFEWLIIDDGSTDNTNQIVNDFHNQNKFTITYQRRENGGKHRAYNDALNLAKGDYFFCVDSDDWLEKDAVKNILNAFQKLKNNNFVIAYKSDPNGNLLSDVFPNDCQEITFNQLNAIYNCHGEFSLVFPITLAKRFPFPDFPGEKFITESVVYDRIDNVSKAVLLPHILTICEYQPEGLSNSINAIMKKNPAGYCLYYMQRIDMQTSLGNRIIAAGKYNCFKIFSKNETIQYTGKYKKTVFFSFLLGLAFWFYYKIFRNF